MPLKVDPTIVRTVLRLLQARQMFIGDEVRVRTLRLAWEESGQMPEDFSTALRALQALGLIRSVHGTAGPAIQLTHKGFRATTQQRQQPSPPLATPEKAARTTSRAQPDSENAPVPAPAQPIAASRVRKAGAPPGSRPLVSKSLPKAETSPRPQAAPTRRPRADANETPMGESIAHSQVFRTRSASLNDNVLRHCMLGLLQHHKLRAHGQLDYDVIMQHWEEMGLTRADLLYTLDLLIHDGSIRTTTRPREMVILTGRGFNRMGRGSSDLNDGMDRFQAKKRLRMTKHLGSMPAA